MMQKLDDPQTKAVVEQAMAALHRAHHDVMGAALRSAEEMRKSLIAATDALSNFVLAIEECRNTPLQLMQGELSAWDYVAALLLSLPAGYRLLSLAERPTNDMLYKPKDVDPRAPWCDPSNESQMLRQIDVDEHCRYWFAVRYRER